MRQPFERNSSCAGVRDHGRSGVRSCSLDWGLGRRNEAELRERLTGAGTFPVAALLYKANGLISGVLTLEDVPDKSQIDGPLSWMRPAGLPLYPAGFYYAQRSLPRSEARISRTNLGGTGYISGSGDVCIVRRGSFGGFAKYRHRLGEESSGGERQQRRQAQACIQN